LFFGLNSPSGSGFETIIWVRRSLGDGCPEAAVTVRNFLQKQASMGSLMGELASNEQFKF
jgi:hypothetical protein